MKGSCSVVHLFWLFFLSISAYNEDALWWLQEKMLFKHFGKNSSSGTTRVQGCPQSVPPPAWAATGSGSGRARAQAGTEGPSVPRTPHHSLTCLSSAQQGWVPMAGLLMSTTLLRKWIAALKEGSSAHCRADQIIPIWKRWAVHMLTVIHAMVCFVLNGFPREDWLVSSAKYFQERNSWKHLILLFF